MALFQRGNFTLASGLISPWKIECDALTNDDWHGLAVMLIERLPLPFETAVGVPRGGVPFAQALLEFANPFASTLLVVDDVWTTGGSMEKYISEQHPDRDIMRAVVFARKPPPANVTAIFTMGVKSSWS